MKGINLSQAVTVFDMFTALYTIREDGTTNVELLPAEICSIDHLSMFG